MKQLHVYFSGEVQGVGFRATVLDLARKCVVTGYVRNCPNGSVELLAEGEASELNILLASIRASRLGDKIDDMQATWSQATGGYSEFAIYPTK